MTESTSEPTLEDVSASAPPAWGYVTLNRIRGGYSWKVSSSTDTTQVDLFAAMENALAVDAALRERLEVEE